MSKDKDELRNTSLMQDISANVEQASAASLEEREAIRHGYAQDLTQLEAELASASAIAQAILVPSDPLALGTDHIDKGRYDEAFQVLTGALRNKTGATPIPAILFQLGRLASARRLDDDAKELFYQAASRDVDLIKKIIDFYIDQIAPSRSERQ